MGAGSFDTGLQWLAGSDNRQLVTRGLRGLEKECLRVTADGRLSSRPHSPRFGSALTHPWITTDYSEALLEFVTPPYATSTEALQQLGDLQAFVVQNNPDELLWPASMPCIVSADESVPIAQYGPSNEGRMRTIYRSGLGFRYGRAMQAIAGAHFNYSLPADFWPAFQAFTGSKAEAQRFRSESLFGLARNFRRFGWLLTYLYGASPAFCKSFRPAGHERLESLSADTWYAPYSTSLRMSDMGYRNTTQSRLAISLNSPDDYLAELRAALTTLEPRYAAIGVEVDGEYRQLNANILQLENEYYSAIRPKPAGKQPRLVRALAETGVEYVEIRTLDLNPFDPAGITHEQMCVVELLALYCLLTESPPIAAAEQDQIDQRELAVAWEGRRPGLELPRAGGTVSLSGWAHELLDGLDGLAALLDDSAGTYARAMAGARAAVADPEATLSARVLAGLQRHEDSFFRFAYAAAERIREHYLAYQYPPGRREQLEAVARESLQEAKRLEAADQLPFGQYLARELGLDQADTRGAANPVL